MAPQLASTLKALRRRMHGTQQGSPMVARLAKTRLVRAATFTWLTCAIHQATKYALCID
jgi:hypothetical protein